MDKQEWECWLSITAGSTHKWVEDSIFRLNGRGVMYYTGGEDGVYIQISKDGILELGIYEGALPHIGEAFFDVMKKEKFVDFNEAFQMACQIGGKKFLMDLFSTDQVPQNLIENDSIQKDDFCMNM
ncbi:MAG: hypothetical protein QM657_03720 [Lacrimispora sp.]|uniref:hypothetical protein n=1 Tax=Lacrimispora sp. TaxID=2719234 RepID=UPI0039E29826